MIMTIRTRFFFAVFAAILSIEFQVSARQAASNPHHTVNADRIEKTNMRGRVRVAQHEHMQHGRQMKGGMGKDKEGAKEHQHGHHPESMSPRSMLAPAEGAEVEILAPRPMQVVHGDEVPLKYRLVKGKRGHHVHAYVDGVLMGMFQRDEGTLIGEGTLTGVEPGRHTLELRTVTADHKTELDAIDVVDFSVQGHKD